MWIKNINKEELGAGYVLQFRVFGLVTSPYAAVTDSFVVTTMTKAGYLVDRTSEGLTAENDCDWPCLSCDSSSPAKCTSCLSTFKEGSHQPDAAATEDKRQALLTQQFAHEPCRIHESGIGTR